MSTRFKEAYTSPGVSSQAELLLESVLMAESVEIDADNQGQDNDGWYEGIDYWEP